MTGATATRGNLPAELTSFIGRRRQLQDVKAALTGARIVTLVGPGGVGKTRLALRAATDLRRGIADGAWLVELAGLRDPELVTKAVMTSLGLRDESSQLARVQADRLPRARSGCCSSSTTASTCSTPAQCSPTRSSGGAVAADPGHQQAAPRHRRRDGRSRSARYLCRRTMGK